MRRIKKKEALNLAFRVNGDNTIQETLQWKLYTVLVPVKSLNTGLKLLGNVQDVLKKMRTTLNSQSVVCGESGREECLMICFRHFLRMSTPVLTKVSIHQMNLIKRKSSIVFGKFLASTPTVTHIKIEAGYVGTRYSFYLLQAFLQYTGSIKVQVLKIKGWYVDRIAYLLRKVKQQGTFAPSMLMLYSFASTQVFNVARLFPDIFYSWLTTREGKLGDGDLLRRHLLKHFDRNGGLNQL